MRVTLGWLVGHKSPPTCRLIIQIGSPESTPASPILDPHLKPLHSPVRPSLPAPLSPSNGRTKSLKASISRNLRDARCFNSARSFVDRWPHPQPLHCAALGGHYYRKLQKSTRHCRNLLKFTESAQERVQAVGFGGGGHPAKVAGLAMDLIKWSRAQPAVMLSSFLEYRSLLSPFLQIFPPHTLSGVYIYILND